MNPYYWTTGNAHMNNSDTMCDYLDFEMNTNWDVDFIDGTYAEITTEIGEKYAIHASGDGDSFNHVITFERLDK